MFPGNNRVKYGLTVPINRSQAGAPGPSRARTPPAAFGEQSSEEEDVEAQIGRHAARKQTDRQTAKLQAAALAEDASIFDYDSHFDALQESRQQDAAAKAKASKSSRYVASLLGASCWGERSKMGPRFALLYCWHFLCLESSTFGNEMLRDAAMLKGGCMKVSRS